MKMEYFVRLSTYDKFSLREATARHVRQVNVRHNIFHEGDVPETINVVLSGWACCYKQLEDGRKQIVELLIPGDMCGLNVRVVSQMDHHVAALTPVCLAQLPREALHSLMLHHPRVAQALRCDTLVVSAIQRQWMVNLGRRSALHRVGHLLCELFVRMRSVGLAENGVCEVPLTQADLATATGLSAGQVHRTLKELRSADLAIFQKATLRVPDQAALQVAVSFNPNYLHLGHEARVSDTE